MSKIIKSLKQAVRYARGDKSAGKLTVVSVPVRSERDRLLEKSRRGQGEWVRAEDVRPETNVFGRLYSTKDGVIGVFYPPARADFRPVVVDAWFFPVPE